MNTFAVPRRAPPPIPGLGLGGLGGSASPKPMRLTTSISGMNSSKFKLVAETTPVDIHRVVRNKEYLYKSGSEKKLVMALDDGSEYDFGGIRVADVLKGTQMLIKKDEDKQLYELAMMQKGLLPMPSGYQNASSIRGGKRTRRARKQRRRSHTHRRR